MNSLDSRTHAFDSAAQLADVALQGRLDGQGWKWVTPRPVVAARRLSLKASPDELAAQVTEALPGEGLELLWGTTEPWWRARTLHDGYLGWVQAGNVVEERQWRPDLTVQALRAHVFAGPKVSSPVLAELCLGAQLQRLDAEAVEDDHRRWLPVLLPDGQEGWVQEVCFDQPNESVTALALRFLDAPYVWGGRSAWGLDCSGLTQTVYGAFGKVLPRDADQQQAVTQVVDEPRAGDLAFFPGHVGLMLDGKHLIHANATGMRVTIETLGEGAYGGRLAASLSGFGRVQ